MPVQPLRRFVATRTPACAAKAPYDQAEMVKINEEVI